MDLSSSIAVDTNAIHLSPLIICKLDGHFFFFVLVLFIGSVVIVRGYNRPLFAHMQ